MLQTRWTGPLLPLVLMMSVLAGCADFAQRYELGLKTHLENEAHKKELERQGFPQYSPPL